MPEKRCCMLMILDGWGIRSKREGNAVMLAKTPFLDRLQVKYPHTQLVTYGESVGLPKGIMGNSEVGHLNIGAGRVVYQDLLRIDLAIKDKTFFQNTVIKKVMAAVVQKKSALHLMGLVSDGGVHSQLTHLLALLDMARGLGLERVFIHAILDGRDTPPKSGIRYIEKVQADIEEHDFGSIATICGRYYAMDRDKRWERVQKAQVLYTRGEGVPETEPLAAVEKAYQKGETDEFVRPIVITDEKGIPKGIVQDDDGIIFFNFRADRAREITRALTDEAFDAFERESNPRLCGYVCMTSYDEQLTLPVAFGPVHMHNILGEVISRKELQQLRIAETEKYAHVTYFFNGGEETAFPGEDRCLVPSPKDVATYDQKPEMSALEVMQKVKKRVASNKYDFIVLNFANMDMVGHTGVLEAAIKACETVDACVREIIEEIRKKKWAVILTADHGNSEKMIDDDGNPHTAHTVGKVRCILVDDTRTDIHLREGSLCDIAPTILEIMGIEQPQEMTGRSLIVS